MSIVTKIEHSIDALGADQWNACFPGDPEAAEFYIACERAGPPGFEWLYVAVREEGHLVAAVPAFGTQYRIDTTVQGPIRRLTEKLYAIMPRMMSLRLLALGSPVAEICHFGFAPCTSTEQRARYMALILAALLDFGKRNGYRLIGVKDATAADDELCARTFIPDGFTRLPGLPTAMLDLPFASFEDYLGALSRATRKDMRRKIKSFEGVRVEQRRNIDDVQARVWELYTQTVAHSDLQFEHLPATYFTELLQSLAPTASIFLYWAEEKLIAFNFVIETNNRLVDKYIGMDYSTVHQFSLYFNSWLFNVRYCIDRGIGVYQSGQAFYAPKLRLGCRLVPNWQYFRHGNVVINALLRLVANVVRLDRFDPAIAALVEGRP